MCVCVCVCGGGGGGRVVADAMPCNVEALLGQNSEKRHGLETATKAQIQYKFNSKIPIATWLPL